MDHFALALKESAIGWSHRGWLYAARLQDGLISFADLFGDFGGTDFGERGVRVAVVADLVTLGDHPLHDFGILNHILANHIEGGLESPLLQYVEQTGREFGMRPIIESDRHIRPLHIAAIVAQLAWSGWRLRSSRNNDSRRLVLLSRHSWIWNNGGRQPVIWTSGQLGLSGGHAGQNQKREGYCQKGTEHRIHSTKEQCWS